VCISFWGLKRGLVQAPVLMVFRRAILLNALHAYFRTKHAQSLLPCAGNGTQVSPLVSSRFDAVQYRQVRHILYPRPRLSCTICASRVNRRYFSGLLCHAYR